MIEVESINKMLRKCLMLTCLISLSSCSYDVAEDIDPEMCDTVEVSFAQSIQPILSGSCLPCHDAASNAGGITLDTYGSVATVVTGGRLVGAIRQETGFIPMPRNAAQLSDCNIDLIVAWIDQGALNN